MLVFRKTLLALIVTCLLAGSMSACAGEEPTKPVEAVELAEAIGLCVEYLVSNIEKTGRFTYRRNTDPSIKYGDEYNLLRHAGAIYALAAAYRREPDIRIPSVIARSSSFLGLKIAPVNATESASAIWSKDDDDEKLGDVKLPPQAKLGGTGLGLVALTEYELLRQNIIPKEIFEQLGDFILFAQKSDGHFRSYYNQTDKNGWFTSRECLYYPGEAMLGLMMLDDLHPDQKWKQAVAKGMAYLARIRKDDPRPPADHWALIATGELLKKLPITKNPEIDSDTCIAHAAKICRVMLAQQKTAPNAPRFLGSFLDGGRTCPTAIRLEGLLAALTYLPESEKELRGQIEQACHSGMRFLLKCQIKEGPLKGGIPRSEGKLLPATTPEIAKDNQRSSEIRIDYVQHALGAMIRYEQIFHKRIAPAKSQENALQ